MLKITVKSSELELHLEDSVHMDSGYTKHNLPDTIPAVKQILEECVLATEKIIKAKQTLKQYE